MAAKIKTEMTIGISDEIKAALQVAIQFVGTTGSQFARQAILEKLVRDGFMRHPAQALWEKTNAHQNPLICGSGIVPAE